MNKFPLIHQIIARIAKENKYWHTLKQHYSISKTEKLILNITDSPLDIDLYNILKYNHYFLCSLLTPIGEVMCNQFNFLLCEILSDKILFFLKKNNIYTEFENELTKSTFFSKTINSVDEYLSYLKHKCFNPWSFFIRAFAWSKSINGYKFWNQINFNLRKYLTKQITKKKEG